MTDAYSSVADLAHERIKRRPSGQPPLDPPGGPPQDSGMDAQLAQLHTDVRDLLKAGIAGFVLVFSALVVAFFILLGKIDGVSDQVRGVGTDVAVLKNDVADLKSTHAPQAQTP